MNYRNTILSTLLAVVVAAIALPVLADPPFDDSNFEDADKKSEGQMLYAPGQVVVGFDTRSQGETLPNPGLIYEMVASLDQSGIFLYQLADGIDPRDAAEQLVRLNGATFAHPNYLLNDLHPVQGSLAFSDQIFSGDFDDQPAAQVLDLPAVHQVATGNAIKVAIIDGGVDFDHPGLDGKASSGYDFVDDDNYAMDEPGGTVSGHGTFVAGVTHLVSPDADIRAYRVMNSKGQGDGFSLARAIERASLDGCEVINVSLVLMHQHLAVQAAIQQAVARGSAVVAAAGNDPTGYPIYPAAELSAIAVAAIDTDMKATTFTSYGDYVDLCAPGSDVYSAYQDPYYAWWSGTSFSTPFVTGQFALLSERFPEASVAQLRSILTSTAQNIDDLNPNRVGGLGAGCIRPIASLYDNCCEMPGDLDGDGIPFETADGAAMDTVFATGNPDYLGACLGNGDLTGDCRIAADDLSLMHLAIMGDTMPYLACAPCVNYTLDFHLPNDVTCCDSLGDLNGNGIAYELEDAAYLEYMLTSGDMGIRAVCLGNADFTGDCRVDYHDLNFMVKVITGSESPIPECGDCRSWVLIPGIHYPDSAWVIPRYQAFEIPAWTDTTTHGSVYVASSGDPLPYTVDIAGDHVVTLLTTEGMTNSDYFFELTVNPSMDTGLYVDTLVFDVAGAVNNPTIAVVYLALGCCSGYATAHIYPYAQAFGAPPNIPYTQLGKIIVTSTNAPANYWVDVRGQGFTQLLSTTGTTNGDFSFQVTTGAGLAAGVYVDTLAFYVDGASPSPKLALLFLEVAIHEGLDSAIVHTFPGEFFALAGESRTQTGNIVVTAIGLPKTFTIACLDDPEFLHLLGNGGMTGEPTAFEVTSTAEMAPGMYVDTVISHVDSCSNSPVITPIYLYIDSIGSDPVGDSAWVYALPGSFFSAPSGEDHSQSGSLEVGAVGGPKAFTVSHVNPGGFVNLHETGGLTDSLTDKSISFDIVTTAGMAPGIYVDSLVVEVADVINSPLLHTIYLNVLNDSVICGSDSIVVIPDVLSFEAAQGSGDSIAAYIGIHSSNQPANYTAYARGGETSFIDIPDSLGTTPDSLLIWVVPDGLLTGVYTDTVIVAVDGFSEHKAVVVTLEITEAAARQGSQLALANYPNPFNPSTEIVYALSASATVTLRVYNILGREVATLVEGFQQAGEHRIVWDGTDESGRAVASGVYLYRLQADDVSTTRRMILLR